MSGETIELASSSSPDTGPPSSASSKLSSTSNNEAQDLSTSADNSQFPSGPNQANNELVAGQLEEEIDPDLFKEDGTDTTEAQDSDGSDNEKASEEEKETNTVPFSQLWRYATNLDGFLVFWGIVGALVNGFSMPLFSLLMGDLTDELQAGNMSKIDEICLLFVYIAIAGGVGAFLAIAFFMYSAERQGKRVREEYLRSILSQDITWHDTASAGDLASKITAYTRRYQDGMGDKLVLCIQNTSGLIFALGISLYKGWELTLILLCPAPVLIIFSAIMATAMSGSMSNEQNEYAQANVVAQESLDAIRTVQSNQMEKSFIKRYNDSLQIAYKEGLKKMFSMSGAMSAFYFIIYAIYALGLFYGGVLIRSDRERWPGLGHYTGGSVLAIFYALLSGVMMMGQVGPHFSAILGSRVAAYELFKVIDRTSDINPLRIKRDGYVRKDDVTGRIRFTNVSFRYPTRPEALVLDNFSHTFECGQMTALCGGSGSGKSTIIQLIERFYDPSEGTVEVELFTDTSSPSQQLQQQQDSSNRTTNRTTKWVNLKDLDIGSWRRAIGLVSQEPILWSGTIMDNIRYGKPNATEEEVVEVAKSANAHNFIMKKREQYNSQVGENGSLLSGGEKQRVSIARSLIMKPAILIFDEATSALDNNSERLVQSTIDELIVSGKYTAITVAHRLSTIRAAKTIVCMTDGKIVETGSHDELVALQGMYYSMLNAQLPPASDDSDNDDEATTPSDSAAISDTVVLSHEEQTGVQDSSSQEDKKKDDVFESKEMQKLREANLKSKRKNVTKSNPPTKKTGSKDAEGDTKKDAKNKDGDGDDDNKTTVHYSDDPQLRRANFIRFVKFTLVTQWKWILLATISAGGVGGSFPLYSFLMSRVLKAFYYEDHGEMKSLINSYSGYFVALGAGAGFFAFFHIGLLGVAGERILRLFRSQVYDNVIRQDMGFHDDPKNSSGIITTKLAADTVHIRALLTEFYANAIMVFITVIVSFIIGFTVDWLMTLVMLVVFPVLTSAGAVQMKVVSGFGSKSKKNLEQAGVVASESVRNIRTVASFNGEYLIQQKFQVLLDEALKIGTRSALYAGGGFGATILLMFCSYSLAFWVGGKLVIDEKLTFDDMLQVFLMIEMAAMMASQLFTQAIHVERASAAITDVYHLIDQVPVRDIDDPSGDKPMISTGKIEFRNVHFHYPTRKDLPILKGVNFVAEPKRVEDGFVLAIVGESGGGKSTMFGLIQRFYDTIQANGDERYHIDHHDGENASVSIDVTQTEMVTDENGHQVEHQVLKTYGPRDPKLAGEIFIDGHNINDINLSHLRQFIGVVEQEPKLFKGTIRENILGGMDTISEDEMIAAAKMANIHDLVMRLPKQYDTVIDSKKVSGGQKQRIAIARSLVRKPKLLLLDEAVSALDNKSMMLVQDALNKAMKGRTTIVIAHRLETIKTADQIVVLSDGVIAETGTHDELVVKNGVYANLVGISSIQSCLDNAGSPSGGSNTAIASAA